MLTGISQEDSIRDFTVPNILCMSYELYIFLVVCQTIL